MTYMVLVNGKYMVKINYEGSNCGAEHFFLDSFNGITAAQAFDEKEIATKWFVRDYLMNAELISIDELDKMTLEYTEAWKEYGNAVLEESEKNDEIAVLERQLAELKAERDKLTEVKNNKLIAARVTNLKLNIKE